MIGSLRGPVLERTEESYALIEVGGVGYLAGGLEQRGPCALALVALRSPATGWGGSLVAHICYFILILFYI